MAKKKKKSEPRIVTLNNKSRKGLYIYIRKDGHSRYYRYHEGMKPKGIIKHYLKELKKIKAKKSQIGRKLIKTKKKPIETQFKKGIIETEIKDSRITTTNLHKIKAKMFEKTIKNKKLLKTIIKDNNLEKIKHRFEIIATVTGDEGTLATISQTGITPDQAIKQINKNLKVGNMLEESPGLMHLNEQGWQGKLERPGTIRKVNVKIVFRKGK